MSLEQLTRRSKKALIGIVGGIVTLAGLIMIPYPGPGWLVVFAGLAILSTEFVFAARLLTFARAKYDQWTDWLQRQPVIIRVLVLAFTGLVIVVTLWLFNAFGFANDFLDLGQDWLQSPLIH